MKPRRREGADFDTDGAAPLLLTTPAGQQDMGTSFARASLSVYAGDGGGDRGAFA
jgi:hypothetical protein